MCSTPSDQSRSMSKPATSQVAAVRAASFEQYMRMLGLNFSKTHNSMPPETTYLGTILSLSARVHPHHKIPKAKLACFAKVTLKSLVWAMVLLVLIMYARILAGVRLIPLHIAAAEPARILESQSFMHILIWVFPKIMGYLLGGPNTTD